MLTKERFREISQMVFQATSPVETELIFSSSQNHLTRIGASQITQNISKEKDALTLRLIKDQKTARVEINQFNPKGLEEGIQRTQRILDHGTADPHTLPLLKDPQQYSPPVGYHESTASFSLEERAEKLFPLIDQCRKNNLHLGGIFSTSCRLTGYANSEGIFVSHPQSLARLSLTLTGIDEECEGWAEGFHQKVESIDFDQISQGALKKALEGKKARALAPGDYPVVLEASPVAELMAFLNFPGSSALSYHEGQTYHTGKLGEKFFSEKLTLRDDAFSAEISGLPFDCEGVARKAVTIIDKGVPVGLVWDRPTAHRFGQDSTGHSLPQPNATGPGARNLIVQGGDSSLEEMISSMDQGLLVSKLHYIRVQDPKKLILTGMTRAGLFWIEKGKIAYPVKNLRFTVSLLDVFQNIEEVGQTVPAYHSAWGGEVMAPPMKISKFHFSSGTDK